MCTTARLEVAGRKSPLFEMHSSHRGWYETIPPRGEGRLTIYFDPNYHKEEGLGRQERAVLIFSNDLGASPKVIRLYANVVD